LPVRKIKAGPAPEIARAIAAILFRAPFAALIFLSVETKAIAPKISDSFFSGHMEVGWRRMDENGRQERLPWMRG
jgi:hypothetical protein